MKSGSGGSRPGPDPVAVDRARVVAALWPWPWWWPWPGAGPGAALEVEALPVAPALKSQVRPFLRRSKVGARWSLEGFTCVTLPGAVAGDGIRRFPGDSDTQWRGIRHSRSSGRGRTGGGRRKRWTPGRRRTRRRPHWIEWKRSDATSWRWEALPGHWPSPRRTSRMNEHDGRGKRDRG